MDPAARRPHGDAAWWLAPCPSLSRSVMSGSWRPPGLQHARLLGWRQCPPFLPGLSQALPLASALSSTLCWVGEPRRPARLQTVLRVGMAAEGRTLCGLSGEPGLSRLLCPPPGRGSVPRVLHPGGRARDQGLQPGADRAPHSVSGAGATGVPTQGTRGARKAGALVRSLGAGSGTGRGVQCSLQTRGGAERV